MTGSKRNAYLLKTYGIDEAEYLYKLNRQGGCCALCNKPKEMFKYNLHVDHNHKTGKVRGIVCYYCNFRRIGRHNFESAESLYHYMVQYDIED